MFTQLLNRAIVDNARQVLGFFGHILGSCTEHSISKELEGKIRFWSSASEAGRWRWGPVVRSRGNWSVPSSRTSCASRVSSIGPS